jgi:malate dehydrogenase
MIAVIGAGNIGSTVSCLMAKMGLDDIVLVDVQKGKVEGEAEDIDQTCSIGVKVEGTTDYKRIKGAKLVIIAAGAGRTPGMSRLNLIKTNLKIVRSISRKVKRYAPRAAVLVVTNPVDAMTWVALKETGFNRKKVIGVGSLTDTYRFRYYLAKELKTFKQKIDAIVIGEHGNSMVPVFSLARFGGKRVDKLLTKRQINKVIKETKIGGAELVRHKGYTSWAPSEAVAEMAKAVMKGGDKVFPASVLLKGEYGMEGLCIGVPVKLGKGGIKKVLDFKLTGEEMDKFRKSGKKIKKVVDSLNF